MVALEQGDVIHVVIEHCHEAKVIEARSCGHNLLLNDEQCIEGDSSATNLLLPATATHSPHRGELELSTDWSCATPRYTTCPPAHLPRSCG